MAWATLPSLAIGQIGRLQDALDARTRPPGDGSNDRKPQFFGPEQRDGLSRRDTHRFCIDCDRSARHDVQERPLLQMGRHFGNLGNARWQCRDGGGDQVAVFWLHGVDLPIPSP